MFERRLAMEDSLSPVASRTSRAGESRRGSTVADTDGKWKQIPRPTIFNQVLTLVRQSHDLLLPHPEVAIPIEAPVLLQEARDLPVYRLRLAREAKERHPTRVIRLTTLGQMTRTKKRVTMAPRAIVRKRMEQREKIKVAREVLEHKHHVPRRRIRSHQLLRHAALVDGVEVYGFDDVQLSFDTYGVWEGHFLCFCWCMIILCRPFVFLMYTMPIIKSNLSIWAGLQ